MCMSIHLLTQVPHHNPSTVGTPSHTTPSCLQVEEEDDWKKDSGRAHEVELLKTLSCSCAPLYRHTDQSENLQRMALQYNAAMIITCTAIVTNMAPFMPFRVILVIE